MRYAVWQLPLLLWIVVSAFGDTGVVTKTALAALLSIQLIIALTASFDPAFAPSYLAHGYLSRFVLDSTPSLYAPTPDVFARRTSHAEGVLLEQLPMAYRTEAGQIRKVLMRRSDESSVAAVFRVDEATLRRNALDIGDGLVYLSAPSGTLGQ